MRCTGCGYRLHGLPKGRCPECGCPFDPDDPWTLAREGGPLFPQKQFFVAIIVALLSLALTSCCLFWTSPLNVALVALIPLSLPALVFLNWHLKKRKFRD